MKMLVSDFDGTFFTSVDSLYRNIEYVKKFRNNNNYFVFATGRSYSDFKRVKDEYKLEYDYLILNHGATIMDGQDNILKIDYLDKSIVNDIWNDLNVEKTIRSFCCSKKSDRASISDENLIKINVKYDNPNLAKEIKDNIIDKYSNFINAYLASSKTLEIVSKESSKFKGVNYLKNKLNIDEIYTIGDGESDIEMIEKFKGYSIKNGVSELQKYSKYDQVYLLLKDIMKD